MSSLPWFSTGVEDSQDLARDPLTNPWPVKSVSLAQAHERFWFDVSVGTNAEDTKDAKDTTGSRCTESSRMRGEGFSFMFGGLGVKVCSLEVGLPTATVPELLAIAAKVVNF